MNAVDRVVYAGIIFNKIIYGGNIRLKAADGKPAVRPRPKRRGFAALLICAALLEFSGGAALRAEEEAPEIEEAAPEIEEAPPEAEVAPPEAEEAPTEAEEAPTEAEEAPTEAEEAPPEAEEAVIGYNLRRNKYFLESLRHRNLANLAILEGEYEQSEFYSEEALRYAELSDQYIAGQLKRQSAQKSLAEARKHLEWAKSVEAPKHYPAEYEEASAFYSEALAANEAEDWDGAVEYSRMVEDALAGVAAPPPEDAPPPNMPKLPAKYTVRPWDKFGDCFWNIAYWFYGDHYKWPKLFEANRDKLPDRNNPDLIEVGAVIDIPEIDGEIRVGMWDSGIPYKR